MRPLSTGGSELTRLWSAQPAGREAGMEASEGAVVLTHARFARAPIGAPLLTKSQVARAAGVSTRTVDRWVEKGLPRDTPGGTGAWCYVGQHRRFRLAETLAWLDAHAPA